MGKNKGFDIIEEAHERANHNINPYYWFNHINNFRLAEMVTSLAFSVVEVAIISLALLFTIFVMIVEQSFLPYGYLFGLLFIFWFISLLRAIKWFAIRNQQKITKHNKPKERKKKIPKHRKDYGRH